MSIANVLRRASDIDRQAAEAARPSIRALRRHLHAGIPHGVFPRRPVALVAPCLEVSFRPRRQEDPAGRFKPGARGFERRAGAAATFTRVGAGIESATPFPLIDVDRHTGATCCLVKPSLVKII
jgi:hypothetical protein